MSCDKQHFNNLEELTDSYYKDYLKMVGDLAPVRSIPGRYMDGIQGRRCSTAENVVVETLPYVLGQCPFGSVIRNHRHGSIRALIVSAYRKNY